MGPSPYPKKKRPHHQRQRAADYRRECPTEGDNWYKSGFCLELTMTRINCVPVQELSGPHLIAEYRELPRVFALAHKAALRGSFSQPDAYTLGKGHLLFFYTRLGYLSKRHVELVEEMKRRGYTPTFSGVRRSDFPDIPDAYWCDWQPTAEALRLNRARIKERQEQKSPARGEAQKIG